MARASRQPKLASNPEQDIPATLQPPLVIVCEDQRPIGATVARTCAAFGIKVEVMTGCSRLFEFLHYMQPSAVISDLVLSDHDGFDVMKIVAGYNRDLPLLMVTSDPILLGAVDAIEELWHLTNVWRLESEPTAPALAEFLQRSGVLLASPDEDLPDAMVPDAMAAE